MDAPELRVDAPPAGSEPAGLELADPEPEHLEPADPDSVSPQAANARSDGGRSRRRWVIGGAVAAVAVAAGIWAAAILGARPLPEALRYLPADSVIVAEIRPELPGDQRAKLGAFLAHFPGFSDQSNLTAKLDEVLSRVVGTATSGTVDYATRVKPLLAGPMVLSLDGSRLSSGAKAGSGAGVLVVLTTDGKVTCDLVFKGTTALETHRAVEVRSIAGGPSACALDGRFMLLGDAASVRAGLDARRDQTGIDTSSDYRTARSVLVGDQVATLYASGRRLGDLVTPAASGSGVTFKASDVPAWVMAGVTVTESGLAIDVRTPQVPAAVASANLPSPVPPSTSRFAATLPANTLGYIEVHGAGVAIKRALAALAADSGQAGVLAQLQGALAAVGGIDNVVGWIDELGIAVIPADAGPGGALMLHGPGDAASTRLAQIKNLLVLASTGTDITFKDTTHNGVTITTVDLGNLGTLGKTLGKALGPTLSIPDLSTAGVRLQLSLASRDGILYVAYGQGTLEKIFDVAAGSGLAGSSAYQRAVDLVGGSNNAQVYLALDGIIAWASEQLPVANVPGWSTSIRPYLEHLGSLALSATNATTGGSLRVILTVK